MREHTSIVVLLGLLGLAGCRSEAPTAKEEPTAKAVPPRPTPAFTGGAPTGGAPTGGAPTGAAPADKVVTTPEQQSYPMGNIKTIADGCATAHTVLATAPDSVGPSYAWPWSRQAMLANQQFRSVAGRAGAHGEVSFDVYHADAKLNNAWVLVANCADGATCNHLAAMYKAIVKSSHPEPVCGDLPGSYGRSQKSIDLLEGGPRSNLPGASDTISKCARIAACTIATNPATSDDLGLSCQKTPAQFKLECASRYPCAEVMACLK